MLKKLVEPVEVPKQQIPPAINDRAKNSNRPSDPIDPGQKESIPPAADPPEEPVQPAAPDPGDSPLEDYVDKEEAPTGNGSNEHERKISQLSDEFTNTARRKLEREGLSSGKATFNRSQIR